MERTVAHIMRTLDTDSIPCVTCGSHDTRLIYGPSNVEKIKDRVLGSVETFLILCKSENGSIVGFNEGYVDSLERIFKLDLFDHYGNVGLPEISKRVR